MGSIIDWFQWRNIPDSLATLKNTIEKMKKERQVDDKEIISFLHHIKGVFESPDTAYYARLVLKRFCKTKLKVDKSKVLDLMIKEFLTDPEKFRYSLSEDWKRNPWSLLDFIVFFANRNLDTTLTRLISLFSVLSGSRANLYPLLELKDENISIAILEAIRNTPQEDYFLAYEFYGRRCVIKCLESPYTQVQELAVVLLSEMSRDISQDSQLLVWLLSHPSTRKKYTLVNTICNGLIVMGPSVCPSLDIDIGFHSLIKKDRWLKEQLALIASDMTAYFTGTMPLVHQDILQDRLKWLEEINSELILRTIGLDTSISYDLDRLAGHHRIDSILQNSSILPSIVKRLTKTKSKILQRCIRDYLRWGLWSFIQTLGPKIIKVEGTPYAIVSGIFTDIPEYRNYLLERLEGLPHWEIFLKYLTSIEDPVGIAIAKELRWLKIIS